MTHHNKEQNLQQKEEIEVPLAGPDFDPTTREAAAEGQQTGANADNEGMKTVAVHNASGAGEDTNPKGKPSKRDAKMAGMPEGTEE